jgi:hypothetical protein
VWSAAEALEAWEPWSAEALEADRAEALGGAKALEAWLAVRRVSVDVAAPVAFAALAELAVALPSGLALR